MEGTSIRVGAPPVAAGAAGAAALAALAALGAAAPAAPSVNVATSCPTLTLSPFATCSRGGRARVSAATKRTLFQTIPNVAGWESAP